MIGRLTAHQEAAAWTIYAVLVLLVMWMLGR